MFGFGKKVKQKKDCKCSVIIAAAGKSTRMLGENKLFSEIGGVPVIVQTLSVFADCPEIGEIIVVSNQDDLVEISRLCREFDIGKVTKIVVGGDTRQKSVLNGLLELDKDTTLVAIHDGARPLVTSELISLVVEKAAETGAAVPVVHVKDTLKICQDSVISSTPDRRKLFAVQTPQVFDCGILKAALFKAENDGITLTDDSAALERIGVRIHTVEGDYSNLKITTQDDLVIANVILSQQQNRM